MSCSCKHVCHEINEGYKVIWELRKLFVNRMTVDSETQDKRRSDYNQAIFYDVSGNGDYYPVFDEIDMGMVLRCFDKAVKDWRKTFCDIDKCKERKVPR